MIYKCRNFSIKELISEKLYNKLCKEGIDPDVFAWRLFSPSLLRLVDDIRDYYDSKILINTWKWNGNLNYCGYRSDDCTIGNWYSMHRRGCAFDLHFDMIDGKYKYAEDKLGAYESIRQDILRHRESFFPLLTGMEAGDYAARIHIEADTNRKIILFEG